MHGSTFEAGVRGTAGYGSQVIPANTDEHLKTVPTVRLWGDNTYGQLGIGTTGGTEGESGIDISDVVGLSIGNGYIIIIKEEEDN